MSIAIAEEIDLSAGQYIKGFSLNPQVFVANTNFKQLKTITRNPEYLQPGARRGTIDADELEAEAEIHALIQRALSGNKKSNVPSYRDYIASVVDGGVGVLPPIHLWSEAPLDVVQHGSQMYAVVPNGDHLLSIDGETQLTAHWTLAAWAGVSPEVVERHKNYALVTIVHHGVPVDQARQYFHDLNVLAVRPNTSLGLSMDTKDPVMKVVGDVEARVSFLHHRVDKQARQLPKKSTKVVTLQSLRQMVVNIAKGISGVQYGARPAPVDEVDLDTLRDVSTGWIGAFMNRFDAEVVDREKYLAGAGPVLAAVGAMGNVLLKIDPAERPNAQAALLRSLETVDWSKGDHWLGIAGNRTASGVFSVKGTKEVAYAIFNALTDPANGGYSRIRTGEATPEPVSESFFSL